MHLGPITSPVLIKKFIVGLNPNLIDEPSFGGPRRCILLGALIGALLDTELTELRGRAFPGCLPLPSDLGRRRRRRRTRERGGGRRRGRARLRGQRGSGRRGELLLRGFRRGLRPGRCAAFTLELEHIGSRARFRRLRRRPGNNCDEREERGSRRQQSDAPSSPSHPHSVAEIQWRPRVGSQAPWSSSNSVTARCA